MYLAGGPTGRWEFFEGLACALNPIDAITIDVYLQSNDYGHGGGNKRLISVKTLPFGIITTLSITKNVSRTFH